MTAAPGNRGRFAFAPTLRLMLRSSCEPWRWLHGLFHRHKTGARHMSAAYLKAPEALRSTQIPFWCAGKVGFDSAVLAYIAATRSRDKRREHYRCGSCGKFHIGEVGGKSTSHASAIGLIR